MCVIGKELSIHSTSLTLPSGSLVRNCCRAMQTRSAPCLRTGPCWSPQVGPFMSQVDMVWQVTPPLLPDRQYLSCSRGADADRLRSHQSAGRRQCDWSTNDATTKASMDLMAPHGAQAVSKPHMGMHR